jgi:glycosyltransferase involved in cell wall biosynthesis
LEPFVPSPRVSIVTTVLHADPAFFAAAVRSVQAQTFRDFEWVVLEKPPHGCVAELLAAAPELRTRHLRIEQPMSLANGRNVAMAAAAGELIAILDADDECTPDRLALQVARFDAEPDLHVLGGALEGIDGSGHRLGYRGHPQSHEAIVKAMRRYNPLAQPAVMLRRCAFAASGGYREYEGAVEDYDLWSRMARSGCRFANLPDVLLRYRIHGGGTKARRLRANLRDTVRVKQRHWGRDFSLGDHLRVLAERALLVLPAAWTMRLFRAIAFRRRLAVAERA